MQKILILAFFFTTHSLKAQTTDTKVKEIIDKNLNVISSYLNGEKDSVNFVYDVIKFFTIITGIPSESRITYSGQTSPTRNDIKRWGEWCSNNFDYLTYDSKTGEIIVRKKILPPIK